jgi:hypothetical protein
MTEVTSDLPAGLTAIRPTDTHKAVVCTHILHSLHKLSRFMTDNLSFYILSSMH